MTMIKKHLTKLKRFLEDKVNGAKRQGAFLYFCLKPFIKRKKTEFSKKLTQNQYKLLNHVLNRGSELTPELAKQEFIKDFPDWLAKNDSHKTKNQLIVRTDASKTGKHYGKNMPYLKKVYDYVLKAYIKSYTIYPLHISLGAKEYIAGYYFKTDDSDGDNIIFQNLLNTFIDELPSNMREEFKCHARITLDGGWGNGATMKWLSENTSKRVAVKSGGKDKVVNTKGEQFKSTKQYEDMMIDRLNNRKNGWKKFEPCHDLDGVEYYSEPLEMVTVKLTIVIVLLKFIPKKTGHKPRYLLLLSLPRPDWHAYQIVQLYKGRWPVETMFRTSKQYCDLEKVSCHFNENTSIDKELKSALEKEERLDKRKDMALERIELTIGAHFICYMVLNWYRIGCTRPSQTSLKECVCRLETHFRDMSPNTFRRLFSG